MLSTDPLNSRGGKPEHSPNKCIKGMQHATCEPFMGSKLLSLVKPLIPSWLRVPYEPKASAGQREPKFKTRQFLSNPALLGFSCHLA